MSDHVRITVLVENSVYGRSLTAEHGLSFHIQIGERSLLFDTGRTALALTNAETLGLALNQLDAVVLSHGHNDHTGGLHLGTAGEERIMQTISRLRAANLDCLAPVHCTGWPATARLWQAIPKIYRSVCVGTALAFEQD